MIGFIGDVHGNFKALFKLLESCPEASHWFQVGDLGEERTPYPDLPSNFFFIQGNHEFWDLLSDESVYGEGRLLRNGCVSEFKDLQSDTTFSVGALGGNYSPNFFEMKASDLSGARRRHFVKEQVQSLLYYGRKIDILLTHEAPSPFMVRDKDAGQYVITEIIDKKRPSIHFFGHHHRYERTTFGQTTSICLPAVTEGYVLYDVGRSNDFFRMIY